ncbi:T9SS type A sorting domain-containing protein [Flavobacterium sp.]|jgi:hypothetical protein|uniref:T9SS type A sorting domain-containing protein n=1 Tax=Flavobacterium sp. TaxID=239 RepID=UPI0037BEF21D
MKKAILLFISIISLGIYAQSPGGVSGSEIWCKVNKVTPAGSTFHYKDFSTNNKAITLGASTELTPSFFNYNYSFSYDSTDYISYLSKLEKLKEATIFIVNLPTPPSDPTLNYALMNTDWNSTIPNVSGSVNEQSFKFSTSTFEKEVLSITYPSGSSVRPNGRINTLLWHNFNTKKIVNSFGSNGESSVFIGKSFTNVANFSGQIPEVIVYRKALNDKEKWRVESYLALKYGITLQPEVNYYTSKNEIFWHKENNGFFKNRIFGIGRDSNSSLYQRQSKSVHQDGNRLVLSRTNTLLPDNYPTANTSNNITDQNFIVMGDNGRGELLNFDEINGITTMKRKWLVQNTGEEAHLFNTSLRYIPESPVNLGVNEAFWLIVDRSPSNTTESNFTGNNIEYYPVTNFDSNGFANFTNLKWGNDTQNFNQFTFGIGPRMLILTKVNEMQCDETEGIVNIAIKGGQPGFTINVHGTDNPFNLQLNQPGFNLELSLNVGNYQVTVTDATGFSQSENFIISPTFNINIQLEDIYNLYNLPETVIDATTFVVEPFENYQFEWIHNGDIISTEPTILVNNLNVGTYILQITNKLGCKVSKQFVVIKDEFYRDIKVLVYPNPSDGNFTVFVNLLDIKDINIEISDVLGKIIFNETFTGKKTYENQYNINASGIYFIRITSKEFSTTHKIIIN